MNAHSARDRRIVTTDEEGLRATDGDDGIGMARSIAFAAPA
jgi:hypothetical protein